MAADDYHSLAQGHLASLLSVGHPLLVGKPCQFSKSIEIALERLAALGRQPREAILGSAVDPDDFGAVNAPGASLLQVAIPSVFEAGQIIATVQAAKPNLKIVARGHSDEEVAHLRLHDATEVILGEYELAAAMLARARTLSSAQPLPAAGAEPPTT
jgi:CPA2 family monovalent cation:H+ antiporter-2